MTRKVVYSLTALALPLLLVVTVGSGVAQAMPVLPGHVMCGSGSWNGSIRFSPPLKAAGVSGTETFTIVAKLGNSANSCPTTTGVVETGLIKGKLKFTGNNANRCSTVFSGVARTPVPASKFALHWFSPPGAPTHWKQPLPFSVVGAVAMTNIAITGGTVTGSFAPFATPSATLSDSTWSASIPPSCASAAGLSSLSLGTASGAW
jgi:hypothetical protein